MRATIAYLDKSTPDRDLDRVAGRIEFGRVVEHIAHGALERERATRDDAAVAVDEHRTTGAPLETRRGALDDALQ